MIKTIAITILLGIIGGLVVVAAQPADAARRGDRCDAPGIPDQYDAIFERAAKRFNPPALKDNWCINKAICWIESNLNPEARSHAGAEGLCQVMPDTAAGLERRGTWRGKLRSAKDNAEASAQVIAENWRIWIFPRTDECRLELVLAGYNAGGQHVIDAQILSGGRPCWDGIQKFLRAVTGPEHSEETRAYVQRFWRAWRELKGYTI